MDAVEKYLNYLKVESGAHIWESGVSKTYRAAEKNISDKKMGKCPYGCGMTIKLWIDKPYLYHIREMHSRDKIGYELLTKA